MQSKSLRNLFAATLFAGSIMSAGASWSQTADPVPATGAEAASLCAAGYPGVTGPDQLSPCQWDMQRIKSLAANAKATGKGVKVGVIDSGIDFTHPDLAGAINKALSCSFIYSTTPTADPREIANGDCTNKDAVQDLDGHGTHVATTIGARKNGIGIVGVAPEATIVALKVCTNQGFCFADSVAAALRYAGDKKLDVVNLSLFADPYLYYCANVAEQKAMYKKIQDAARYAQQQGVVIVAAAGNESQDLGHPTVDDLSPDWPPDTAETRRIRNNCKVAPTEIPGVVVVSASGFYELASYSTIGNPVDVTAPGGDGTQLPGTYGGGRIFAGYSSTDINGFWDVMVARNRAVESNGGRYVWISGTSMASPHAAGVAALIRQLHPKLAPGAVAAKLRATASPVACPADWPVDDPRRCKGGASNNSFYGSGMVNANKAVAK